MKKILFISVIVLSFLFVSNVFCVTIEVPLDEPCEVVSSDGSPAGKKECSYTITDIVPTGTTQEFRLETELYYGNVKAYSIDCISDDFDFWFSNDTGLDESSTDTYIYDFDKAYHWSPSFYPPRDFINRDGQATFFTFKNNGISTDNTTKIKLTVGGK